MKRTQMILAALFAVTGIGAAYASQPKVSGPAAIYRWHTVGANFTTVLTAATAAASLRCNPGSGKCLIGTSAGLANKTLPGIFH
ncbi:hypothetical protein [Chitinophaga sp. RAB17]|uniref:hypothetical protein n=1 Tax=Chitinophaga sp. RAB17 TaxID=3233049 RepID=UPI003F91E1AA